MYSSFNGIFWLVLMLAPLIVFQRVLHREIQAVIFIATRGNAKITMALFSILFFPGIILHEFSHFIMAKVLFVRTRNFSVIPKMMPQGYLRMGYVEVSQTDIFRDALIGAAPLIFGSLSVAYIAIFRLYLTPLWEVLQKGQMDLFWLGIAWLPGVPDFALWFYLTFAISSTMLPSQSDRNAWLPLGFSIIILISLALFAGAGSWMMTNLAPLLNAFLQSMATLFGLCAVVHGVLIPPVMLIRKLFSRWLGWDVGR